MTGIYVRVQRDGEWQNLELDTLTDRELLDWKLGQLKTGDVLGGWQWAARLATWIRYHHAGRLSGDERLAQELLQRLLKRGCFVLDAESGWFECFYCGRTLVAGIINHTDRCPYTEAVTLFGDPAAAPPRGVLENPEDHAAGSMSG